MSHHKEEHENHFERKKGKIILLKDDISNIYIIINDCSF